jgi:hypothetical protein
MTELRPEFEKAGAKLAVVTAIDTGAQDFIDAAWKGGEIYIEPEEVFKNGLPGSASYKSWWLLKPSVAMNLISFVKRFGNSQADISDKKTQLRGGTLVIKDGKVVHVHRETASFDNGNVADLLAACRGAGATATPLQTDAVQ